MMMSTSLLTASNPSSTSPHFHHLHHNSKHHLSLNRQKRQQLTSILTSTSPNNESCQVKMHKTQRTRISTNPNVLSSPSASTARVMAAAFLTQSLSNAFTVANLKAQLLAHHYTTQNLSWGSSVDDALIDDGLFISGLNDSLVEPFRSPEKQRRSSLGGLDHLTANVISSSIAQVEGKIEKKKKVSKQVRFADTMPGRELVQIRLFQSSEDEFEKTFSNASNDQSALKAKVTVCRQQSITKMSPMLLKHLKDSLEDSRVRASSIRNVNRAQEDVLLSDDDDDDAPEVEQDEATGDEEESSDDDALIRCYSAKPVKTDSVEALLEKRLDALKLEKSETENTQQTAEKLNSASFESEPKCENNRFDIDNFSFEWSMGQLFKTLCQDLDEKLQLQNVKLVNLHVDKTCISGQIMVKNLCYHKRVFLNYTFDNWQSTSTLECVYEKTSNENHADIFGFKFDLEKSLILRLIDENFNRRSTSPVNQADQSKNRNSPPFFRFEFAIGFEPSSSSSNECFWDNNDKLNYHLDCYFKVSSPLRRCL